MEVIVALQHSSKGRLDYSDKLKSKESFETKILLLDDCNSLPPISPAIKNFIASKQTKPSQLNVSEDVDSVPNELSSVSFNISSSSDHMSIVDEVCEELDDCEASLDDLLLRETGAAIAHHRKIIQSELQVIREKVREDADLQEFERHQELLQLQERTRLEDMCRSLNIDEWKRRTLEEYRIEEEKLEAKLIDGENQTNQIIKLKEERRKKLCEQYKEECQQLEIELASCLQACQYPQFLPPDIVNSHHSAAKYIHAMHETLKQSSQHQIEDLGAVVNNVRGILEEIKLAVQMANLYGVAKQKELQNLQAEAEKRAEEERQKKIEEEKLKSADQSSGTGQQNGGQQNGGQQSGGQQSGGQQSGQQNSGSTFGMPKSVISLYSKLQDMLQQTASVTSSFSGSKDPNVKKYRFELQKAVNITVNSISANSGEGLLEKIYRFQCLLGGKSVDVMGKAVNTTQHPQAKLYCCNLLAKKLVKQGEDQVSSNSEAAFPIAAVAIGLWSKFPEIGEHILAHFHSDCPILVPMYLQKSSEMTDTDYMRIQGYKISSSGVVETEDMFLHRMRGIVRLYAAIISSPQLPVEHTLPHPHGLEHGWAWLTRVLNMQPHPTLTAAALGDFLEVAGHAMMQRFGKQFTKLVHVLWKKYVPRMEKCTPSSQRGPIARLTQFLEACITSGTFPRPTGYLHAQFWRTKSKGIAMA